MLALADYAAEFFPKHGEVGELALNGIKVRPSDHADRPAILVPLVSEIQKSADLFEVEAQIACPT